MSDSIPFSPDSFSSESQNASLIVQAMASIGAVAWRWNLERDEIVCSDELADFLGIDLNAQADGLLGLLLGSERLALCSAAQAAYENREVLEEQIHLHIEGSSFPFRFVGSRLDYGEPNARCMAGILIAGVDTGQLFNSILNNAQVLVYVKDLDGRYLFANRRYADACKQDAYDFVGKTDREMFSPEKAEALRVREKQVIDAKQFVQVEEKLAIAVEPRIYLSGRFPIANNQGDIYAIGGILTDITRLKIYERTIRNQRQELQEVIDAIPAEVSQLDVSGKVLAMNRQAREYFQLGDRKISGLTLAEIFPDAADSLIAHSTLLKCIESGKPDAQIIKREGSGHDGSWIRNEAIPLRASSGGVAGLLVVATDITEIKENEVQIARREARYSAFIANSSEAIIGAEVRPHMPLSLRLSEQLEWLMENFYCTEANHISTHLFGQDVPALVGQKMSRILRPENIDQFRAYLSDMLSNNFKVHQFLCQMSNPAGDLFWLEVSARGRIEDEHLVEVWSVFRDVTERQQQELALRRSEKRYRNFIAKSHEGIFSLVLPEPLDKRIDKTEQMNLLLSSMYISESNNEFKRQYPHVKSDSLLSSVYGKTLTTALLNEFINAGYQLSDKEVHVRDKNGKSRWYFLYLDGIFEDGQLTGCWGISRDITERHEYWDELEFQANHDSLTLLPNRKALYEEIERRLESLTNKKGNCVALMLIDLDRFKEINDTLGHHIGDKLLKLLGPRLQAVIPSAEGLVARLGGDEFAIVVTQNNEAAALDKAFKVLHAIKQTFDLDGFRTDISASIGISFGPKQSRDVGVLMRYADVAMYRAKTESAGVLEYNASFDEHTPKRLSLITDLGRAVKEQQLYLLYQPKVDLQGNRLEGVEALLRWKHPIHGIVPPGDFIPLAETSELIRVLTLWVLDEALAQCRRWRDQGIDVPVAINLSTRNLHDENILLQVKEALERYQLSPANLELEITESSIMADPKRALRVLKMLDDLGVSLAIDDFGTGYSSLAYLKKLPVDLLKIDASFVTDMLTDEQDAIIVNSTINLAHNLGLKVIAEGVESAPTLDGLRKMNCDQVQGYFVGRPMDAMALSSWLLRTAWLPRRLN